MINEKKLDKIQEDVTEIKVILARNTTSLEDHMRRTTNLENRVEPLVRHVTMVQGVLKLVSILAMLAAIVEVVRHF